MMRCVPILLSIQCRNYTSKICVSNKVASKCIHRNPKICCFDSTGVLEPQQWKQQQQQCSRRSRPPESSVSAAEFSEQHHSPNRASAAAQQRCLFGTRKLLGNTRPCSAFTIKWCLKLSFFMWVLTVTLVSTRTNPAAFPYSLHKQTISLSTPLWQNCSFLPLFICKSCLPRWLSLAWPSRLCSVTTDMFI